MNIGNKILQFFQWLCRFNFGDFDKEEFKKFEIGNFRLAGEIHYWLYDKLSLKELLQKNDFKNVIKTTSSSSRIPDWPTFELDEKNGVPYDPKSLFMEATK